MINEKRVNEIISQISAFTKEGYSKREYLPELIKLQKELVEITFNPEHADNGDLRLWDVERHLQEMNYERGNIAQSELAKFIKSNKVVCNTIRAEFSGNIGEQKVFKSLENLCCQNGVLHNVELELDGKRTEIDAIVFTNRAVFIIEIKNSKKDIFIDEEGEFFRTGHSMHYDCNIAVKMNEREALLRKVFEKVGLNQPKIFRIVTFTNPRIDVENKYHFIKVCGINYLNTFIEKFTSNQWYTYEDICTMMAAVSESRCADEYKMTIDVKDYKKDFAVLMTKLEGAMDVNSESEICENVEKSLKSARVKHSNTTNKNNLEQTYGRGVVVAAAGITLINVALLFGEKIIKEKLFS